MKCIRGAAIVWAGARAAVALAVAVAAGGCATNTATGRYQFDSFDREREIEVGEEAMPALVQEYGGHYPAPELSAYVTQVGMVLVAQVEDPEKKTLPWEFVVLDSDIINAFALPGGKVFISRALLVEFDSEAQLAGVLGHEIGHVTAEHAEQRIGRETALSYGTQIAGAAASVFGGAAGASIAESATVLVGAGGQGFMLKFSRDEESEADTLGLRYMVKAGYDPEGMLQVMEVLKAASEGGSSIEILSTHPDPGTRLERVSAALARDYPGARGNPALKTGKPEWSAKAAPYLGKGSG